MPDYIPGIPGPLDGVRVMDLSRLVAGNILSGMLADFGAEVIKVEPLSGDTLRAWRVKGVDTSWKIYGRNKRSLAIDFRHPRAREVLLKLASTASIFIESFRPGTLEAMKLSPDILHETNPRLVIVRISGYGQDGPYSRRPGFGTLIEGISGFASMNGFGDREPVLPPFALADAMAGLNGAAATMFALREVEMRGGRGQVIDLPLLEPLFTVLGPHAANYRVTGRVQPRTGSRSTNTAPRNAYETSDGKWVCLSASIQAMTERLLRSIGREDLVDDPKFRTNADRLANVEELDGIVADFIAQRTLAENVAFFEKAEVTIGPIYDISQIVEDPHFRARRLIEDYPDPDIGALPMHAVVPRMSGTPGTIRTPAPTLGANTRDILASCGFEPSDIDALVDGGAVATGPTAVAAGEEA